MIQPADVLLTGAALAILIAACSLHVQRASATSSLDSGIHQDSSKNRFINTIDDGSNYNNNNNNIELLKSTQSNKIDVDSESQHFNNNGNSNNTNHNNDKLRYYNKTRLFLANIQKNLNQSEIASNHKALQEITSSRNNHHLSILAKNNSISNNNYSSNNSNDNDLKLPNLYSYYANIDQANNSSADGNQFRVIGQQDGASVTGREILINLREGPLSNSNPAKQQQQATSNPSKGSPTLFLLNYSSLPSQVPSRPQATVISAPEASRDKLAGAEQQQAPPLTIFPTLTNTNNNLNSNNNNNNNNNRQPFLNNNNNFLQRQPFNIGQLFSGQQQAPNRQQQVVQQQQQQQQQQPFLSPLQFLTAPFQAAAPFLPQLQTAQFIPPVQSAQNNPINANNQANRQQYNTIGNSGVPPAHNQQHNGQSNSPPSLQSLYQQLPLYQAILAARQRQMALLAERQRQQQLLQNAQLQGANGNNPRGLNNQQQIIDGNNRNKLNNASLGGAGVTGNRQHQQKQPNTNNVLDQVFDDNYGQNNNNNNNQPLSNRGNDNHHNNNNENHQNQFNPQSNHNNQAAGGNNNEGPHANFDDDGGNGANNGEANNGQSLTNNNHNEQPQPNDNDGSNGGSGGQEDQSNQGDSGGNSDQDDPDIKQFQNLAGNGDFPADVFPPGILSDSDIKEIKKQQEEQARRQEEEEHRKQLKAQQRQNNQDQPPPQQEQQPHNEQPVNNFNQQYQPHAVGGPQSFGQFPVANNGFNNQQIGPHQNPGSNPNGFVPNSVGGSPHQNGFAPNVPTQNGLTQNGLTPNSGFSHQQNQQPPLQPVITNNNQSDGGSNAGAADNKDESEGGDDNDEGSQDGANNETEGGQNDDQPDDQSDQDQPSAAALSGRSKQNQEQPKNNLVVAKASKPNIAHVAGVEYSSTEQTDKPAPEVKTSRSQ